MTAYAATPSVEYQSAFLAMLDDFDANDSHNSAFYTAARQDFSAYVQELKYEEQGINLPFGKVQCSHRWLVSSDGALVGVTRLRHSIETPFLAANGGHIGYDVAPSRRGQGFGHFALAVALNEAKRIGLSRVLLYAGETNAASRAIIGRAGGVLEQIAYSEFWNEQLCKYWVPVSPEI